MKGRGGCISSNDSICFAKDSLYAGHKWLSALIVVPRKVGKKCSNWLLAVKLAAVPTNQFNQLTDVRTNKDKI